jgi:hypothetical protein
VEWLRADSSRVKDVLDHLSKVTEWKAPAVGKNGKVTWSDEAFYEEMCKAYERGEVTKPQLATLLRMVVSYGDQLPAPNPGIALPNSPDGGEIEELFKALEARALNEWETKFVKSLRQQYDTKKTLSEKQLAILRKVAGGEAEDQRPNNEAASQELLAALAQVKTWNAPLKRGKRTYDDQDFIDSLKSQLSEKHSLTERQFEALKKLVRGYREQIANYAAIAAKFEIKEPAPRRAAPAKKAAPKKASAKKH